MIVGDSAMALFDDGGYEDAFSSRCFSESDFEETSFERSFDLSSREELLSGYEIPDAAVHHFSTLKNLKKICMAETERGFTRYVAFDLVDKRSLLAIDKHRETRSLPNMRVFYDEVLELLIIKIMVGAHHESAGGLFGTMVTHKLGIAQIGPLSLRSFLSTRFGTTGRRQKEADLSFRPESRDLVSDWPTWVVEIGVSESLRQLRNDAFFWLTKSGGATRIVLIIKIFMDSEEIKMEHWENVATTRPQRSSTPSHHPGLVHTFTLQRGVMYTGPSLLIPFSKVYDALPPGVLPSDNLEFTAADLNYYLGDAYWRALH